MLTATNRSVGLRSSFTFKFIPAISMLFTSGLAHAGTITVTAPCGSPGLRDCATFLQGTGTPAAPAATTASSSAAATTTAGVTTSTSNGVIGQLDNKVTHYVSDLYKNVEDNPLNPPGNYFGATVCDLVPSKENNWTAEITKDHNGKSCGNIMPISFSSDGTVLLNKVQPNGTLEDGYLRGGYVQALACFSAATQSDIQQNPSQPTLHVTDVEGQASPCASAANDYNQKLQNFQSVITNSVTPNLAAGQTVEQYLSCGTPPTQAAAHICSSRGSLESAFLRLSSCQVFAPAQAAYLNRMGSAKSQASMQDLVTSTVDQSCYTNCRTSNSENSATACANTCYGQQMPQFLQNYIQKLWPSNPGPQGCQSNAKDTLPMLGGFAGSLRLLRGRKRQIKFRGVSRWFSWVGTMMIAAVALVTFSCSSGSSSTPPATQIQTAATACPLPSSTQGNPNCCSNGVPLSAAQISAAGLNNTCNSPTPGTAQVVSSLASVAADIAQACSDLNAASATLSPQAPAPCNTSTTSTTTTTPTAASATTPSTVASQ